MKHEEIVERLPEFVDLSLSSDLHSSIERHLTECRACRDWVATYEGVGAALAPQTSAHGDHPTSEALAAALFGSGTQQSEDVDELKAHLDHCPACRSDQTVLAEAFREAGWDPSRSDSITHRTGPRRWHWSRAIAAALGVVAIVLLLLLALAPLRHGSANRETAQSRPNRTDRLQGADATSHLSQQDLGGVRKVTAQSSLIVSDVKVLDGARVRIQAGGTVAFGDGFQVGRNASVVVGAGDTRDAN